MVLTSPLLRIPLHPISPFINEEESITWRVLVFVIKFFGSFARPLLVPQPAYSSVLNICTKFSHICVIYFHTIVWMSFVQWLLSTFSFLSVTNVVAVPEGRGRGFKFKSIDKISYSESCHPSRMLEKGLRPFVKYANLELPISCNENYLFRTSFFISIVLDLFTHFSCIFFIVFSIALRPNWIVIQYKFKFKLQF